MGIDSTTAACTPRCAAAGAVRTIAVTRPIGFDKPALRACFRRFRSGTLRIQSCGRSRRRDRAVHGQGALARALEATGDMIIRHEPDNIEPAEINFRLVENSAEAAAEPRPLAPTGAALRRSAIRWSCARRYVLSGRAMGSYRRR